MKASVQSVPLFKFEFSHVEATSLLNSLEISQRALTAKPISELSAHEKGALAFNTMLLPLLAKKGVPATLAEIEELYGSSSDPRPSPARKPAPPPKPPRKEESLDDLVDPMAQEPA